MQIRSRRIKPSVLQAPVALDARREGVNHECTKRVFKRDWRQTTRTPSLQNLANNPYDIALEERIPCVKARASVLLNPALYLA